MEEYFRVMEQLDSTLSYLSLHPTLRTCSSDTILRAIKELTQENISHTSDMGKNYDFNTADTLNALLLNCMFASGQLKEGGMYDVDFDHQFMETEEINGIEFELNSILVEKWKDKAYRLVIQRQKPRLILDNAYNLWV